MSSKPLPKIYKFTRRAISSFHMLGIFTILNKKDMQRTKKREEVILQRGKWKGGMTLNFFIFYFLKQVNAWVASQTALVLGPWLDPSLMQ